MVDDLLQCIWEDRIIKVGDYGDVPELPLIEDKRLTLKRLMTRVWIFLGRRLLICGATTLENHIPPCINLVEGAQMPESTLQVSL